MIFPLLGLDRNQILSIDGKKSNFCELKLPDLELYSEMERAKYRGLWMKALGDHSDEIKFYFIKNKAFVSSKEKFVLQGQGELTPCPSPLESIFEVWDQDGPAIHEDYFYLGACQWRLLKLAHLPSDIDFLGLRKIERLVVRAKVLDVSEANFHLEIRRRSNFSKILAGLKNLKAKNDFEEIEQVISSMKKGEEKIVRLDAYVLFKVNWASRADIEVNKFIAHWRNKGFEFQIVKFNLQREFARILPGVYDGLKGSQVVPLSAAVHFLNLTQDRLHETGVAFANTVNGESCFDLFHEKALNYNLLVTGPSGQGKSMLAAKIVKHNVDGGLKAMILDLGGSFKRLNRYVEGSERGHQFNPLESLRPSYLLEFTLAVCGLGNLTPPERGKLLKVIRAWVKEDGPKHLEQLVELLDKERAGISDAFEEIRPYLNTNDLNQTSSSAPVVYVDFQNIPSMVKRAYLVYLFEAFGQWQGKRILLIDECWDLLNQHADFVSECFRTFRKHNASAIAIGQGLGDFLNTSLGQVIFENSFTKILFHQVGKRPAGINEQCWKRVQSVSGRKDVYSEFVVMQEERSKVLRYYPTEIDKCLFNTSAETVLNITKFLEAHEESFGFKKSCNLFGSLYFGDRAFSPDELELLGSRHRTDGGAGFDHRPATQ